MLYAAGSASREGAALYSPVEVTSRSVAQTVGAFTLCGTGTPSGRSMKSACRTRALGPRITPGLIADSPPMSLSDQVCREHRAEARAPMAPSELVGSFSTACRTIFPVDLSAQDSDGSLINRRSIPRLDRSEIGLAGLVSRAHAPAVGFEEVRCRGERVPDIFQIADAVIEDALGEELCVPKLTVHGTSRAGGKHPAVNERHEGVELLGEIGAPTAVVG